MSLLLWLACNGAGSVSVEADADAYPTENHDPFMDRFLPAAAAFDRPILFIHGDGHGWIGDTPWPAAPQVTRVQIEAAVLPLLVTVEGDSWTLDREPF